MVDTNANSPLAEIQSTIDEVEQWLRQGEPLLAYNAVQVGLNVWPENLRLRQLGGLAIARSGDIEQANRLLCELATEGIADAETLGMLARTHKISRSGQMMLQVARSTLRRLRIMPAYRSACVNSAGSDARYTGINAAAIAVLQAEA